MTIVRVEPPPDIPESRGPGVQHASERVPWPARHTSLQPNAVCNDSRNQCGHTETGKLPGEVTRLVTDCTRVEETNEWGHWAGSDSEKTRDGLNSSVSKPGLSGVLEARAIESDDSGRNCVVDSPCQESVVRGKYRGEEKQFDDVYILPNATFHAPCWQAARTPHQICQHGTCSSTHTPSTASPPRDGGISHYCPHNVASSFSSPTPPHPACGTLCSQITTQTELVNSFNPGIPGSPHLGQNVRTPQPTDSTFSRKLESLTESVVDISTAIKHCHSNAKVAHVELCLACEAKGLEDMTVSPAEASSDDVLSSRLKHQLIPRLPQSSASPSIPDNRPTPSVTRSPSIPGHRHSSSVTRSSSIPAHTHSPSVTTSPTSSGESRKWKPNLDPTDPVIVLPPPPKSLKCHRRLKQFRAHRNTKSDLNVTSHLESPSSSFPVKDLGDRKRLDERLAQIRIIPETDTSHFATNILSQMNKCPTKTDSSAYSVETLCNSSESKLTIGTSSAPGIKDRGLHTCTFLNREDNFKSLAPCSTGPVLNIVTNKIERIGATAKMPDESDGVEGFNESEQEDEVTQTTALLM